MRTSIATVSLSGSLVEKLHACAAAGFDGVEIFEPDLIAGDHSPEEIRALAARLGLSLNLYQPLRDLEGVDQTTFADNLRRARATFVTAQRLGIDTVLVCSNAGATATVDDDDVSASQLRRIGDLAGSLRPVPPEEIRPPADDREFRDFLNGEYQAYLLAMQDYLNCLGREHESATKEVNEIMARWMLWFGDDARIHSDSTKPRP